jgi:hypothetical protein
VDTEEAMVRTYDKRARLHASSCSARSSSSSSLLAPLHAARAHLGAEDESDDDGHKHGEDAREHHLLDRSLRRDLDAARRVGVRVAVDDVVELAEHERGRRCELEADLGDDGTRAAVDREHRQRGEDVGQAGTEEDGREDERVREVDDLCSGRGNRG